MEYKNMTLKEKFMYRTDIHSRRQFFQWGTKVVWAIFRLLLIIGMAYVILYPVLCMLSKAFSEDIFTAATTKWIPRKIGLYNVNLALQYLNYKTAFLLTLRLAVGSSLIQVASCAVAAYGFARFEFPGKKIWFTCVIITIIVPAQTYLLSQYVDFRYFDFFGIGKLFDTSVNLLSTVWTFWLPAIFGVGLKSGLFIYIMRQFFLGMPRDLEEAATIDGCGAIRTFLQIMMPNALVSCITVFLFSLVWHWNDYYTASTMFQFGDRPLAVMLFNSADFTAAVAFTSTQNVNLAYVKNAAAMLAVSPLVLVFLVAQNFFIESIDRVGIKG
ncbi:MAG: carbohydrate ABC transporter permease [Bacillota bacterium]|nr:carbohydrate ABC transporter permease [Bacillota bacterium]